DGSLWAWGNNESGQIERGGDEYILSPMEITDNVKDYVSSYNAIYVIYNDGSLWYWGETYQSKDVYTEPTKCEAVYDEIDWGLEEY
ncbi:MAG TPA: hypothetical protein H9685_02690, partial [Firmicutes bacterium]|nr:hypothetical protein [Bacillota bacterium]